MSEPRAVLYLRQSIAKEDSISLDLQETACRAHAEKKGYIVVAKEEDPGVSGRTFKRPGVTRVMDMMERKEADVIILWKWSRLSRSNKDWILAADRVESIGGRIESATEDIDTSTSVGQLNRGMFIQFAAFESNRIGDVWKETQARRITNGLPHSGKPRFGYTYSRENGYQPDPLTSDVLLRLYLDFIAGTGFLTLARTSKAHGGPQQGTGLRRMMDAGFAAGYITYNGQTVRGAHEAILSEAQWKAYNVARKDRRRRPRAESGGHVYSGLVRCECGYTMTGNHFNDKKGRPTSRYQCSAVVAGGDHTNAIATARIDEVVQEFLESLVAGRVNPKVAGAASKAKPMSRIDARPQILAEMSKLAVKIDNATDMFVAGDIQKDTYDRTVAKYREQLRELQDRLDSLEVQQQAPPPMEDAANLAAHWEYFSVEIKRAMMKRLGITIIVSREGGGRWNPKEVRVTGPWDSGNG